jgi:hypothetical protein
MRRDWTVDAVMPLIAPATGEIERWIGEHGVRPGEAHGS